MSKTSEFGSPCHPSLIIYEMEISYGTHSTLKHHPTGAYASMDRFFKFQVPKLQLVLWDNWQCDRESFEGTGTMEELQLERSIWRSTIFWGIIRWEYQKSWESSSNKMEDRKEIGYMEHPLHIFSLITVANPMLPILPSANTNGNNKEVDGKFGKGWFSGDDAMNFPQGWFQPPPNFQHGLDKAHIKLDRAVVMRRSSVDTASQGFEFLIEDGRLSPAQLISEDVPCKYYQAWTAINQWTHVGLTYDGSSSAKDFFFWKWKTADVEISRSFDQRNRWGDLYQLRSEDEGPWFQEWNARWILSFWPSARSEIAILSGLEKQQMLAKMGYFFHSAPLSSRAGTTLWHEKALVIKDLPPRLWSWNAWWRETHILERGHYENRGKIMETKRPQKFWLHLKRSSQ